MEHPNVRSIELFAGGGGLAIATERAGFRHDAVLEWDRNACETIRRNRYSEGGDHSPWNVIEGDVRDYSFSAHAGTVDFVSGGPPCQPFSIGGKHRGLDDSRDMFPEAVRAIREIVPKAFLFENVKGLLRKSFANYYAYIINQLTYPEISRKPGERWEDHASRLQRAVTGGRQRSIRYNVVYQLLNAADFGVPQRRERVLIVGVRADLGINFAFPHPTHDHDALLHDKWVTGDYWERHGVSKHQRARPSDRTRGRIERLPTLWDHNHLQPWRTVRDAILGLPAIGAGAVRTEIANHYFNPGARVYAGHNGSPLDEPAKALKAGDHGVPGGENMLRFPNGSVRYFSVRECARLQTFPDDWLFEGSWTESMRQLGNAVPVSMAQVVAAEVHRTVCRGDYAMQTIRSGLRRRHSSRAETANPIC